MLIHRPGLEAELIGVLIAISPGNPKESCKKMQTGPSLLMGSNPPVESSGAGYLIPVTI